MRRFLLENVKKNVSVCERHLKEVLKVFVDFEHIVVYIFEDTGKIRSRFVFDNFTSRRFATILYIFKIVNDWQCTAILKY